MIALVLARKAYARRLQYRTSHALRTLASVLFGLIYISLWNGIGTQHSLAPFGRLGMVSYMAFNQASLWTLSGTFDLGFEAAVRDGQIALFLMRPTHLFIQMMSREAGVIIYQVLYTGVPLFIVYAVTLSILLPPNLLCVTLCALSLLMGTYISMCMNYLVGIASLWTTECRWLSGLKYSLGIVFSGFLLPTSWLPAPLRTVSLLSPFPCLHDYTARFYLGQGDPSLLARSAFWCACMTAVCLLLSHGVRRKVEVQGG